MSVSIIEALENAAYNFENNMPFAKGMALSQLNNAIELLNKDYPPYTEVEPLLEKYGDVEDVPYFISEQE